MISSLPNVEQLIKGKQLQISYASSVVSAVQMVAAGRAELLWGSDTFNWHYRQLTKTNNTLNFKQIYVQPSGIWVSNSSLHHREILERFRDFSI